jgi:spore maturation protein CgeB
MRILIVDKMYAGFLAAHYAHRPELAVEPYDVQWRALMDQFFGTADSYSHYLGLHGHPAHEVVVNCAPLQRRWASEHRTLRLPWRDSSRLVLAQAAEFQPDVVYVQDLRALPTHVLRRLARGRLLVGQIASEPPSANRLRQFDLILTSFPHFVDRFRALGVTTEYFRIGFDPRVLDRLGAVEPDHGAVFVGSLGRIQHASGNALLERAARRVAIDFWGLGSEEWPPQSPIRRRYRGEAWGIEMFRVLSRARIALNRHIDVADGYANNMRLYEATGVGTLLVTDERRNLPELFEPQSEVVTYANEEELIEKIAYYLEHEDERAAIARAGRRRTLQEHTYAQRMHELVEILARYGP